MKWLAQGHATELEPRAPNSQSNVLTNIHCFSDCSFLFGALSISEIGPHCASHCTGTLDYRVFTIVPLWEAVYAVEDFMYIYAVQRRTCKKKKIHVRLVLMRDFFRIIVNKNSSSICRLHKNFFMLRNIAVYTG